MAHISTIRAFATAAGLVAVVGGIAFAAQDRNSVRVPNGLSFADFKGYEDWRDVAVSQTEHGMKAILANDVMIKAYRSGLPASGKLFPEGSKVVKIEWTFKKNEESPYFVNVPDTLKSVSFIEKDTKKYPKTHGWAFAQFEYDNASGAFKPSVEGTECGYACHTKVAAKDYIFTAYPMR